MGTAMVRKGPSKGAARKADASEDLASDVAAFASQLGLTAAGGGGGFDDFRPEKAQQRIGIDEPATVNQEVKKASTNKFKPNVENAEVPAAQRHLKLDPELEAAIKERTWNEGVGERPGAGHGCGVTLRLRTCCTLDPGACAKCAACARILVSTCPKHMCAARRVSRAAARRVEIYQVAAGQRRSAPLVRGGCSASATGHCGRGARRRRNDRDQDPGG